MKKMTISIHGLNDVYKFIEEATKVEGDITVTRGKFTVDGKSIMGIFSLDMSQNVTVTYPEYATEFERYIKSFQLK